MRIVEKAQLMSAPEIDARCSGWRTKSWKKVEERSICADRHSARGVPLAQRIALAMRALTVWKCSGKRWTSRCTGTILSKVASHAVFAIFGYTVRRR